MGETFLDRLIKEKEELEIKISKLLNFVSSDKTEVLDGYHLNLLMKQFNHMSDYLAVLKLRIEDLNNKK